MTDKQRISELLTASPAVLAQVDRILALRGEIESAPDRIIRRGEAAALLGRTKRSVDTLAAAGILERVRFPGRELAAGFRLSDVQNLIAGRVS